jgi:hypothetical protein
MVRKQRRRQERREQRARQAGGPLGRLPIEALPVQAVRRRRASPDEEALRARIQDFAYQRRFKADFERAMELYFGEDSLSARPVRGRTLVADEADIAEFQEWYIHDFVTSENERIVDLLAREVGPSLPPAQSQMLDDWRRTNRRRLLEIQEVRPGVGETVQDLLSGEVFECHDVSTSRQAKRWQIVLARPLLTEGRLTFTGVGQLFSPLQKDEVLDFARGLWEAYRREHPDAAVEEFYRDRSLEFYRFCREMVENPPQPRLITPEGHDIVRANAEFAVRDHAEVERRLDEAEELNYAGPSREHPGGEHYNWLLRGRAAVPEATERPKRAAPAAAGTRLQSEFTLGPGQPSYLSLGDLVLTRSRLNLECLSRERLQVGRRSSGRSWAA